METLPGQKQLTASVLLTCFGHPSKILLLYHKKHQSWLQPGGHVEPTENPLETAIRETLEETGIDISKYLKTKEIDPNKSFLLPQPDFVAEYKIPAWEDEPQHYHIDWLYVVNLPTELEPVKEIDKATDIGWFTLEQVEKLSLFENTRQIVQQVLKP